MQNPCSQSAGLAVLEDSSLKFSLSFLAGLLLIVSWCQRIGKHLIVHHYFSFESLLVWLISFCFFFFFGGGGGLHIKILWIENKHWDFHHWSNQHASQRSRGVLYFPFPWNMLLPSNLSAGDSYLRTDWLTSGPLYTCNLNQALRDMFLSTHSFVFLLPNCRIVPWTRDLKE